MRVSRYLGITAVLALCGQYAVVPKAASAQQSAIVRLPALRSLGMVTPALGWALGGSSVLRTTTGGDLWVDVTPEPEVVISQDSRTFALGARLAWVTATRDRTHVPTVERTIDGGHTWRPYVIPLPSDAVGIGQISFVDAHHGWLLVSLGAAAGSEGAQILRTIDGGASWATVSRISVTQPASDSLPLRGVTTGITFRDVDTGWAVGTAAGPENFSWISITHDGGHTWQHQSLTFPAQYRHVLPTIAPPRFFTARDGLLPVILKGSGVNPAIDFYATHDGGATWTSTTPLPYTLRAGKPSWDFVDQHHGWVAIGSVLYVTVDGGRHWKPRVVNLGVQRVTQLDFVNAADGWALGATIGGTCIGECLSGHSPLAGAPLLRTTDGGHTWTRLSPDATNPSDGVSRRTNRDSPGLPLPSRWGVAQAASVRHDELRRRLAGNTGRREDPSDVAPSQ